jgi:hypothetical protein
LFCRLCSYIKSFLVCARLTPSALCAFAWNEFSKVWIAAVFGNALGELGGFGVDGFDMPPGGRVDAEALVVLDHAEVEPQGGFALALAADAGRRGALPGRGGHKGRPYIGGFVLKGHFDAVDFGNDGAGVRQGGSVFGCVHGEFSFLTGLFLLGESWPQKTQNGADAAGL